MVGGRWLMRSHGLTCSWAAGPVLFRRAPFGSCKREMCCDKKKKKKERRNFYMGKFDTHQTPFTTMVCSTARSRKTRTPASSAGHKTKELTSWIFSNIWKILIRTIYRFKGISIEWCEVSKPIFLINKIITFRNCLIKFVCWQEWLNLFLFIYLL